MSLTTPSSIPVILNPMPIRTPLANYESVPNTQHRILESRESDNRSAGDVIMSVAEMSKCISLHLVSVRFTKSAAIAQVDKLSKHGKGNKPMTVTTRSLRLRGMYKFI